MKALISMYYEDIMGIILVPEEFDLEGDRKSFFKELSEAGKLKLQKDGSPVYRSASKALRLHQESLHSRFGGSEWEFI